jgi:hypothetical protein
VSPRSVWTSNVAKTALIVAAFGLLGGGIYLQQRHISARAEAARGRRKLADQQALLDHLRENPLFAFEQTSWSHHSLSDARKVALAGEEADIDTFACYVMTPQDSPLRTSLAYMLLVSQAQRYLDWAAENPDQLSDAEVQLWISLLEEPAHPALPAGVRARMDQLATQTDAPAGLWHTAKKYEAADLIEDASAYWQKLLAAGPSVQGVAAARAMVRHDFQPQRARAYLQTLAENSDAPALAAEAIDRLVQLYGAANWIEYRRWKALKNPANTRALLQRLAESEAPKPAGR